MVGNCGLQDNCALNARRFRDRRILRCDLIQQVAGHDARRDAHLLSRRLLANRSMNRSNIVENSVHRVATCTVRYAFHADNAYRRRRRNWFLHHSDFFQDLARRLELIGEYLGPNLHPWWRRLRWQRWWQRWWRRWRNQQRSHDLCGQRLGVQQRPNDQCDQHSTIHDQGQTISLKPDDTGNRMCAAEVRNEWR